MSFESVPTSTLRELLEQAESLKQQSFEIEKTITLKITGTVIPDGPEAAAIDTDTLSVAIEGAGELEEWLESAVQDALNDDPCVCGEVAEALSGLVDGLEALRIDLADTEEQYGVDEETLGEELEEKTGMAILY